MIVLGVGGNLGTDAELRARFRAVRARFAPAVDSAPLYRSAPIGPAQPPYLNTALAVRLVPEPSPGELLAILHDLEHAHGRTREGPRFGPRTLDVDVLLWDARVIATPELIVPHPRLHERHFALAPVVALLGDDHELPGHGPAGACLARVRDQAVTRIADTW